MSIRDQLQKPTAGLAIVVVCLAAAVGAYFLLAPDAGYDDFGDRVWVYFPETQTFDRVAKDASFRTIEADGQTGYMAMVFSCDECKAGSYQVAYVLKYTDEAIQAVDGGEITESNQWVVMSPARSQLAATPEMLERGEWVPAAQQRLDAMFAQATAECDGYTVCWP